MSVLKTVETIKTVEGLNAVHTNTRLAFPALIQKIAHNYNSILWIDSTNSAKTHYFESRPELLEKISIARAFTPLQHHQLCKKHCKNHELIVAPAIDILYKESSLYRTEAVKLFKDAVNSLKQKKLLFSTKTGLGLKIKEKADNRIKITKTDLGLKFEDEELVTTSYFDAGTLQTTVKSYEEVEKRWEEPIKPTETV